MKARPLKNLCEHEGRRLPADYKSDCYNDVDEGDYACNEKKRILVGGTHWIELLHVSRWGLFG